MRKLAATIGLTTLFVTALAIVAPAAASAAGTVTTCNGELEPGTYGRVVVPEDGACFSDGPVTITGGLVVERGATVVVGSDENAVHTATISGGVVANDAMNVQIHFSTINGGGRIHGGSGPFGRAVDRAGKNFHGNPIHRGGGVEGYDGVLIGF